MRSWCLLVAFFFTFVACQKDPDETLDPPNCKLESIFYYNENGTVGDTAKIEYNGDLISKVSYGDYYVIPEYANGLISKRNFFLPGSTTLLAYDVFTYNPDSTISKVEAFIVSPQSPVPYPSYHHVFSWTGKKLDKLEYHADTSGSGPALLVEDYFTYTGDNITRVINRDLEFQYSDTLDYTYDGNSNYYRKNPSLWLTDLLFADFISITLPFALSANNVTSVAQDAGTAIPSVITYSTTSREEIQTLIIDGGTFSRYNYKCQ
jgi:hypothetical protein